MVQVPILSGIYASTTADLERSLPVNLTPIAESGDGNGSGVSKGYLRLINGVRTVHVTDGADRGGYVWNGTHLRVIGPSLCEVTETAVKQLGDLGSDGKPVQFAEGFGRVAIATGGDLYYWDGSVLAKVADPDLGKALSVTWSDGYFLTTDGSYIVATELNDPTSVDPLKYGSSEADPDPVIAMLALRGEVYALNRYTIEKFLNAGTTGFPFQRSRGSQIPKGVVGRDAYAPFVESFAFCGSARDEGLGIYLAGAGQAVKISPRVVDAALGELSSDDAGLVQLEAVTTSGLQQLLVHLSTGTWVYHWTASQALDTPVWSQLRGDGNGAYPARHHTLVGNDLWCGSDGKLGVSDAAIATLFDAPIGFSFDTPMLYNAGMGGFVHSLELVTLGGRGTENQISVSYSDDGVTWSNERFVGTGSVGARLVRALWRRLGRFGNWRIFRFRGVARSQVGFLRLEAEIEPLNA
jgi:hypothetical protein